MITRQKRYCSTLLSALLILTLVAPGCAQLRKMAKKREAAQQQNEETVAGREIARHSESGSVVKVYEEQKNGVYIIRIQVIKNGEIKETIHHFDNYNFSISVPVSDRIVAQTPEEARENPDTNVTLFSQKLEMARESMLKTDYVTAMEAINEALRIDSYNPQAHMMKGSIFYAMGKKDLAKKEFDYVLKIDPDNKEVKQFLQFLETSSEESPDENFKDLEEQ